MNNYYKQILLIFAVTFASISNAWSESYVRYQQNGSVSWGELQGEFIHQLNKAPYLGGTWTGTQVSREDVKLMAPVDPKDVYMTGF